MNAMQLGIIRLLQSAITGEKLTLPEGFSLEAAQDCIKRHHLYAPIYAGAVHCGIPTSQPLMQALFQHYCRELLVSEGQMQAVQQLFQAFDEAQIDYLPLKGCNMKALYPKPELRPMSDADILIRMEQYAQIRPLMQKLGYLEMYESDHELAWKCNKLHVELHKRVIPSYNYDYFAYFGDGWRLAERDSECRYRYSDEDAFVYLVVHFAKHYRDGGIGCRHVLDLWVYRRSHPLLNEAYIHAELEKLQLATFYQNMRSLIACWFEGGNANEIADFMTDFIFDSGSWGKWENHILSHQLRAAPKAAQPSGSKIRLFFKIVFPTAKLIEKRYPILEKHPRLLPIMWPVRWIDVLLHRPAVLRTKQRELQLVNDDSVSAYQAALHFVGLDFHFEE